jgi:hypothetical protein
MGSRILFSAILALGVLGISVESQAADGYRSGYHSRGHYRHSRAPLRYRRSYAFSSQIGGHLFGDQHSPFPFASSAGENYPGFYNNQSFWERVQTQPNYPVQY